MAVNSVYTFPRAVETAGLPKAFIGGTYPTFTNTFVAPLENNPIHADGMAWAKKYVMDRARINTANQRNYNIGGTRNLLPKPQPQGSFFRIQGNSGSNHYGSTGQLSGMGGTFRTKQGAEYGRRRLRQRGEELERMAMESEMGLPVGLPGTEVPVPQTEDETKNIALDLAISSVKEDFDSGDYGDIKAEDLRKIFNSLRTDGLKLTYDTLSKYYDAFASISRSLRDDDVRDDGVSPSDLIPKSSRLLMYRIFLLITALINGINLEDREKKAYISSQVKRILKVKDIGDDPLTTLPPAVLDVSRQRLPGRVRAPVEPMMVEEEPVQSFPGIGRSIEEPVGVEEGAEALPVPEGAELVRSTPEQRRETYREALEELFENLRGQIERSGRAEARLSGSGATTLNQRVRQRYAEKMENAGLTAGGSIPGRSAMSFRAGMVITPESSFDDIFPELE
jgi:hypothetical protein